MVLKRVHELYEERPDWDIRNFYYEVVDSATAIFLHNVYKYSDLKNIFGNGIYRYDFPSSLGYLLFVADTICEWMRNGTSDSNLFHLSIDNGKFIFKIHRKYKDKMENSIKLFDNNCPIELEFYTKY